MLGAILVFFFFFPKKAEEERLLTAEYQAQDDCATYGLDHVRRTQPGDNGQPLKPGTRVADLTWRRRLSSFSS